MMHVPMEQAVDAAARSQQAPMRILLGTEHPYLPQIRGGAQSSTHELATAFIARGHHVAVVCGLTGAGWIGWRGRAALKARSYGWNKRRNWVCDRSLGYEVHRAWFARDAIAAVASHFDAQVAVLQSGLPVSLAARLDRTAVRTFIYLRNVELDDLGGNPAKLEGTGFIANSQFTANSFRHSHGLEVPTVYPLVLPDNYRVESTRQNVTFINPRPCKGLDIALAIARSCPDIPFVFVEAWTLDSAERAQLKQRLAQLPNVTLRPATGDMRSVYRHAGIILAPSIWNEAFGRVAAEAHISGIPVVGSDCGGLPEAIGPGGTVVPRSADIAVWVRELRRLWQDPVIYAQTAAAAVAHAAREAMNADRQVDSLIDILRHHPV
ncbi:glycosyltransferase [Croceicoccus sp. F390]|uniref:Glycosyltransferase n=1 Tax=Croceicoccus esteveae TaxID=3075597 RepID=A0ABU2ZLH2_9SPHN|nr:glycosyltransferase [Croceicoccus sp. F390]MDT0576888.1 glycosyltransferase [Croceicoccus sp. F390]